MLPAPRRRRRRKPPRLILFTADDLYKYGITATILLPTFDITAELRRVLVSRRFIECSAAQLFIFHRQPACALDIWLHFTSSRAGDEITPEHA